VCVCVCVVFGNVQRGAVCGSQNRHTDKHLAREWNRGLGCKVPEAVSTESSRQASRRETERHTEGVNPIPGNHAGAGSFAVQLPAPSALLRGETAETSEPSAKWSVGENAKGEGEARGEGSEAARPRSGQFLGKSIGGRKRLVYWVRERERESERERERARAHFSSYLNALLILLEIPLCAGKARRNNDRPSQLERARGC
jgi:hypothetical protein